MTWMFMYGGIPALRGPIATAMGGVDFSWLAGTVTSSVIYFALGYARFRRRIRAGVPLGIRLNLQEEAVVAEHGDACEDKHSIPEPATRPQPAQATS